MELYPFSIQPIKGNNCGLIPEANKFEFLQASSLLDEVYLCLISGGISIIMSPNSG